jgi:two-component system CheB/CheR fusion protein
VGLTLVKTLVEMHGGNVEACSPGRNMGSTFTVRLPLAQEKATRDLPKTESVEANTDGPDARPNTTPKSLPEAGPRRQIVLVEDLDESRDMLKTILELEGHSVATAQDGENGCELILNRLPDVAIVDIGLPGISGYEVARRVRSLLHDQVYLIALTGYGQQQDTQAALQSGFNAHLVKPAAMETLFEMLAKIPKRSADKPHSSQPAVDNNPCEAQ